MGDASRTLSGRAPGEARQHFRSPRKLAWDVEFAPVGDALSRQRALTAGVSLGGAFVVHDTPPAVGTDLVLWLHPDAPAPGGLDVLRLRAQVRWIDAMPEQRPRGFGVAFRALTAADEVVLHGWFSRSSTKVV